MRYLVGFVCVCALAVLGCDETTLGPVGGSRGSAGMGGAAGMGGGGVGGDGSTPRIIDEPGECFEVFGPNGLCFPPRAHDLGVVELGDSREVSLGFFNFCGDTESSIIETVILEDDGLSPSMDFEITRAPTPGERLRFEATETVHITLSPTFVGWHRARVRFVVSHGYYDFDLVAEVVEPGGHPAPFETDCLEVGPTMTFTATLGETSGKFVEATGNCKAVFGSSHIVLVSHEFASNEDGAFSIDRAEAGRPLVSFIDGEPACDDELALFPWVAFSPPGEGSFEAVLTLITNEPDGEHEVVLLGSTGN